MMKAIFTFVLMLISVSLYAQDSDDTKWFHLEGINNPYYKVYLNVNTMNYVPGVTIIADLKYRYLSDSLLDYSISRVKFIVSKDTYQMLSNRNYNHPDKNGRQSEQFTKSVNPPSQHLIPGSEMSVIYQSVYIQAVAMGPAQK
jgi:hypothetical protein